QHIGREILHLVRLAGAPGGVAEAAHVDGHDLAITGEVGGDVDPVIGEIGQAVQDQDRRLPGLPERPIEDLYVLRFDRSGLVAGQFEGHGVYSWTIIVRARSWFRSAMPHPVVLAREGEEAGNGSVTI